MTSTDFPVDPAVDQEKDIPIKLDDSLVGLKGILAMLAYLLALCLFLAYSLVSFWPSPAPLVVSSFEPNQGQAGDTVKIAGSGFTSDVKVSFDGREATVDKVESTAVTVKLPEHKPGLSLVAVKNPAGQTIAIPNGFTFTEPVIPPKPVAAPATTPADGGSAGKAQPKAPAAPNANQLPATAGKAPPKLAAAPNANRPPAAPAEAGSSNETSVKQSAAPAKEYRSLEGSNLTQFSYLWFHPELNDAVRMLIIVMIVGALGSLIHVSRSFYWYVGNRTLKNSWLIMYILLPFNGGGLAVLFYLIIRGGISPQAPTNPSSLDGYAAIAALVGMFSQEAMLKLKKIAGAFFTEAEPGKDPAIPIPKITGIKPDVGPVTGKTPVTITGTGFADGNQVTFGGVAATEIKVASSTRLTATTPAHAAGAVDVEVSSTAGQKSVLPGGFKYQ
jgi:hypothetical protein